MTNENKQVGAVREYPAVERITEEKLVTWMEAFGVAKQLQPNEKKQFIEIATAYQLNPFKREIYCNAYGEGQYRQLSIITGYEVYLKRAERTGDLAGWNCTTEGSVEGHDLRAIITIHRKSWTMPLVHEVEYSEYIQTKKDGTPTKFWSGKPKTMIKKVAMAQGFRLAFPDELGDMPYTSDELPAHMTGVIDTTAEPISKSPQRKSATEPTAEDLAAKAEAAKEQYKATEATKSATTKPQGLPEGHLTATGTVISKGEANAGGYIKYSLEGHKDERGWDIGFSTKDPDIQETLDTKLETVAKACIEYTVSHSGKYTNYNIIGLIAAE